MKTDLDIKHHWLHEANAMGVTYPGRPDRLLWPWPMNVKVGDVIEENESHAIWELGIIFTLSTDLPTDSLVMVQRINDRYEEPWVAIRITSSKQGDDGKYIIEGKFDD